MARIARITFPVPLSSAAFTFVGPALLMFLHSRDLSRWAYADWFAVNAEFRQGLLLVTAWVAGCSAWVASTFTSQRSLLCPPGAYRGGWPIVVSQAATLTLAAFLGTLLGLLPTLWWASRNASYGGLNLLLALTCLAILLASVGLGYTAGCVLPRRVSSVAVAAIVFGGTALLTLPTEGALVAPIWPFGVIAGIHEVAGVSLFRLAFFAGLGAVALAGSALWLQERSLTSSAKRSSLGIAAISAPVLLVVVTSLVTSPDVIQRDIQARPLCKQTGAVFVCVHPARASLLDSLADATSKMSKALGTAGPTSLGGAVDGTLPDVQPLNGGPVVSLQLQGQLKEQWLSIAITDMATSIANVSGCSSMAAPSGTMESRPEAVVTSEALAIWLAREAGANEETVGGQADAQALVGQLASKPADEARLVVARILNKVRSCQGEDADFR